MPSFFANEEGHMEWEVPGNVTRASFALWGGSSIYAYGAIIEDLEPGEILHFNLGGNQINSGWNGGGASAGAVAGGVFSSGGGGASDVRRGSNSLSDRIIIAGGARGMTVTLSPGPGFGGDGLPAPDWPGTYWLVSYDTLPGEPPVTVYATPHFVSDGGAVAVEYPFIGGAEGPALASGSNGADSVSYSVTSYLGIFGGEEGEVGSSITVHLGAGGGGYVGGDGGEMIYRQADPLYFPDQYNYPPAYMLHGQPGMNWAAPELAPLLYLTAIDWVYRPDYTDLFFGQRLLSGAIFVSWEETGFQGWSTGSVRVGTAEGW